MACLGLRDGVRGRGEGQSPARRSATSVLSPRAESLGRQFTEIDRRFGEVNGRFTEVNRRFDDVDLRFTELRQNMLGHFDAIYHRFERLEQEYHAITTHTVSRLRARIPPVQGLP